MHELPSPVCPSVSANKHKCCEKKKTETLKLQMTSFALSSSANTQRTLKEGERSGWHEGNVEIVEKQERQERQERLVTLTHLLHDEAK